MRHFIYILSIALTFSTRANSGIIEWKRFDDSIFEEAETKKKLVFLTIGAAWCHWCHVMDQETYNDIEMAKFLKENFILSREDQDSRPDLYVRYKAYGWPAIIIFDATKNEIYKFRGYQEKQKFRDALKQIIANPSATEYKRAVKPEDINSEVNVDSIQNKLIKQLDTTQGALNGSLKYLNEPIINYLFDIDDQHIKNWIQKTISNSLNIIDPIWSGMYQYSAMGDWKHPHFEKLLRVQANAMIIYSKYFLKNKDDKILNTAESIYKYCNTFLKSDSPLFYTSQNADLVSGLSSAEYYNQTHSGRLKLGIPDVQKRVYLKENMLMCKALLYLWTASNNRKYLERASSNFNYILNNFEAETGLYLHEQDSIKGYFLEENLLMLEGLILSFQITNDKYYLTKAENLELNILNYFSDSTSKLKADILVNSLPPVYPFDLNCFFKILTFKLAMLSDNFPKQNELIDSVSKLYCSSEKTEDFAWFLMLKKHVNSEAKKSLVMHNGNSSINHESFFKSYLIFNNSFEAFTTKKQNDSGIYLLECSQTFCSSPITSLSDYKKKEVQN